MNATLSRTTHDVYISFQAYNPLPSYTHIHNRQVRVVYSSN